MWWKWKMDLSENRFNVSRFSFHFYLPVILYAHISRAILIFRFSRCSWVISFKCHIVSFFLEAINVVIHEPHYMHVSLATVIYFRTMCCWKPDENCNLIYFFCRKRIEYRLTSFLQFLTEFFFLMKWKRDAAKRKSSLYSSFHHIFTFSSSGNCKLGFILRITLCIRWFDIFALFRTTEQSN